MVMVLLQKLHEDVLGTTSESYLNTNIWKCIYTCNLFPVHNGTTKYVSTTSITGLVLIRH